MRVDFSDTLERIVQLEKELEREIKKKNREIVKNYHKQKIRFEESIRKQQEKYRVNLLRYVFNARLRSFMLAPIIYFMVIPISFFDASIFIYQQITFRVLGIPIVERKDYFTIDRHHLGYLNLLEKFNCVYCGYAPSNTRRGSKTRIQDTTTFSNTVTPKATEISWTPSFSTMVTVNQLRTVKIHKFGCCLRTPFRRGSKLIRIPLLNKSHG